MLFLLWLLPTAGGFLWYAARRRRRILRDFAGPALAGRLAPDRSGTRRIVGAALLLAALLLSVLALAGPTYGFRWRQVERRGVDIVLALDCSKSMLAQDVKPSRLARAKREIIDLLSRLRGDRVGLVAFAGTAFLQCPLTADYSGFHIFLDSLGPDFLPVGGTAVADAIDVAVRAFDPESPAEKVVILLSDGEPTGGDPLAAARRARDAGVKLDVMGVGSPGGAPVPRPGGGFVKDASGNIVLAKLAEDDLKQVAAVADGLYVRSVAGDEDWQAIYDDGIRGRLEARRLEGGRMKVRENRFQWPLALAVVALAAELAVPLRRKMLGLLLVLALLGTGGTARAESPAGTVREGLAAWKEGDYEKALSDFVRAQVEAPDAPEIAFDVGNAYYRTGKYDEALESYAAAARGASGALRPDVHFNMGNAAYRLGRLEEAVKHYDKVLDLRPDDEGARRNRDFVKAQIEKKKSSPPPPKGEKDDAKKGKGNDKDDKKAADGASGKAGDRGDKDSDRPDEKPAAGSQETASGADGNGGKKDAPEKGTGEAAQHDEGDKGSETDNRAAQAPGTGQTADPAARQAAARMLNRLEDRPGRAMMPSYGKRRVEKDW